MLILALVFGSFSIWYYFKNNEKLYKVAFIVILLFGLLFMFMSPLDGPSDEMEHIWRAEITSQGVLFPEYTTIGNVSGFESIYSLATMPQDVTLYQTSWYSQDINTSLSLVNSAFIQNPFYLYLVQGFGVFLAKLLDFSNLTIVLFARFFNLLFYSSLAAFAIKKTPILKVPMFIAAVFPLTIVQGASVSADAFIIGFSFIVIAYLLHMYKSKEASLGKKEIGIFFILVLILALSKVTYGAFALLIFLVPSKNLKNTKTYYYLSIVGIMAILSILLVWTNYYALDSLLYSWRGPYFAERHVCATEQLNYILSHPFEFIITFLHLPNQLWNQVDLFSLFYVGFDSFPLFNIAYFIFFTIICFVYPVYENILKKERLIIGLCLVILIVGTYFVQYLTWSVVGDNSLSDSGVFPRYFIPIMALLPFVLNINRRYKPKNLELTVVTLSVSFLISAVIFVSSFAF